MDNEVKEPALKYSYTSAGDYLEMERASMEKHELHHGTLISMQGASLDHNRIVTNLIANIHPVLKGKSCSIFPSDLRTKFLTKDSFTYPDVTIVCGEPELLDDHFDTLLNPSAIIEVLSPSSENYDKGFKFMIYMQILSVKEYIMVSFNGVYIHISRRQKDNLWKFEEMTDPAASFFINTIAHNIPVKEIYYAVTL